MLLVTLQNVVNKELDNLEKKCSCHFVDGNGEGTCENVSGIAHSSLEQLFSCAIPRPPEWPALLQVPGPEYRAAKTKLRYFKDLPNGTCRKTRSCPTAILLTGANQSFAESLGRKMFATFSSSDDSDALNAPSNFLLGTDTEPGSVNFVEPAFLSARPIYIIQPECSLNSSILIPIQIASARIQQEVICVQGLPLWRESFSVINDELFNDYSRVNPGNEINEFLAAYDFLNSDKSSFNVRIWYNSTYRKGSGNSPPKLVRVLRSLNLVSNAYLHLLRDHSVLMQFEFVKEMPKPATQRSLDFSSLLGPLFFTWVIQQLFPVMLTNLVYEKQQRLKIMMKMHGLGDSAYWMISYAYFLSISSIYMFCFVIFGSVIGLKFFSLNDYSIQFVFYFVYINLQIAFAFLVATIFSDVKTARVIGYIYVFGLGLLGAYLFQFFLEDISFSRGWVTIMETVPVFSLYRGLYELAQYSFMGNYIGTSGMLWRNLSDKENGMGEILIIMIVEWLVLFPSSYYLDQGLSSGSEIRRHLSFFLQYFHKRVGQTFRRSILQQQVSEVFVDVQKPDVYQEKKVVEQLLYLSGARYAIVCDNVKMVYPGTYGNPEKLAVQGISLALPRGECFGMLGPNGAGKTSFINMMIGLATPTSGTAYVQGLDIRTDVDKIYTSMGVCPQHDLLWETLTGKEHLMFYGRLKNLKGAALTQAVEESLKRVNLFHGGLADKQVGQYSGGMQRRLSVAISMIGDPKVVYMDEPSTGLDPASRSDLWKVVNHAKKDRAIILTTHSMEEAEFLCDRLGIVVDGSFQCIGNPKELKARYGGSYVFTMATSSDKGDEVEKLVLQLSLNAKKIYCIPGTQKFELPKQEVKIADVFRVVENAKRKFGVQAWGLTDTTLEDVFVKVAKEPKV